MPRNSILDTQRRALRIWHRSQYPRPPHKDCIKWFSENFHFKISQSTISESLSDKFKSLDDAVEITGKPSYRRRQCQWPLLEKLLYEWQQDLEKQGTHCSGEQLIERAQEIWTQIPDYEHIPVPEFSSGWLSRFKVRHNIRYRKSRKPGNTTGTNGNDNTSHRADLVYTDDLMDLIYQPSRELACDSDYINEHGSKPRSGESDMLSALQVLCQGYTENNIYTMQNRGLYWRKAPSTTLYGRNINLERDRNKLTLLVCTNCSGNKRLPLLFIGSSRYPQILEGLNLRELGGCWKYDQNSMMNENIMKEWLFMFYEHVGERSVLLTMDCVPAHKLGLELAPPPRNVKIAWLPPPHPGDFYPLGQCIVGSIIIYYRKHWLSYMATQFEIDADPFDSVTLYHAVLWALKAWKYQLSSALINQYFVGAGLVETNSVNEIRADPLPNLTSLYDLVLEKGRIQNAISFHDFICPAGEIQTKADLIPSSVPIQSRTFETSSEPPPSLGKAIEAITTALKFRSGQDNANPQELDVLKKLQIEWTQLHLNRQLMLEDYLLQ